MEAIKIILEFLIVLIGFYIIFFKSYFKKKGENLATKQDIANITKEIEKVKNEFSFQNQKKADHFFEIKESLLSFYDNYFVWVYDSMKFSDIILTHHDNNTVLRESINNLKKAHRNVLKSYTKLFIYLKDDAFKLKITEIYGQAIESHNSIIKLLITLEDISMIHNQLKDKIKFVSHKKNIEIIKQDYEKLKTRKDECINDYNKTSKNQKDNLAKNDFILTDLIQKKLEVEYALTHNKS
ncbi:hypothetical protein [Kordia sp.]|uniref:hypothetical protein n=1 Tax=Kordia sp. TaxID=1965332 RepID=UPI003B5A3963